MHSRSNAPPNAHRRHTVSVFVGTALVVAYATKCALGAEVTGVVIVSPSCPGPQRSDRACTAPFADARVELRDAQDSVVAHAVTSDEGRFRMNAPTGSYTIRVVTGRPYPRCESPE